jgi:hypothetical protein
MQAKSIEEAMSESFEAKPEEVIKQSGDGCNGDSGEKRDRGPDQAFPESRLLHRLLFRSTHNVFLL